MSKTISEHSIARFSAPSKQLYSSTVGDRNAKIMQ